MTRLVAAVLLAACLALSACGKKGDPKSPNEDTQFPRTYPATK